MANNDTGDNETGATQFSLGRVYLKDVSLEAPNSPDAFLMAEQWNPKVTLQYKVDTADLANDTYEVVLTLTISAVDGSKTIFLVEIQQGGIFLIQGVENAARLDKLLNERCPKILFPYAREAVDSLVVKASFPPLLLGPINFGIAHREKLAARAPVEPPAKKELNS